MKEEVIEHNFKNMQAYLLALNTPLPETYKKSRDIPTGKHYYYPAPIKEATADAMFHYWNVIDEKYSLLANELLCTVTLQYMPDYPGAFEQTCTGSAAVPVQMDANANVADFPAKKKKNALEYNVPSVRSEAIGNALNGLGNCFGRNVGRKISKDELMPEDFNMQGFKKKEKSNETGTSN